MTVTDGLVCLFCQYMLDYMWNKLFQTLHRVGKLTLVLSTSMRVLK